MTPPHIAVSDEYLAAQSVADEVLDGFGKAIEKHAPMTTLHEGYAVLLEEVDEVWAEVKGHDPQRLEKIRKELLHVAAMAMRMIVDVVDPALEGGG